MFSVTRPLICLVLPLLLCLPAAAETPSGSRPSSALPTLSGQRLLASLKIGLTRTEAEKVLTLAHARLVFSDRWGSGQSDTYRLDKQWTVMVSYDYSGTKSGKNGYVLNLRNPQNKIVSLPTFVQEEEKIR